MGEFDHRLCLCKSALHSLLQIGGLALHFLVDLRHSFSEAIESVVDSLDRDIEVATSLGVRVCVLLPNGVEQALQIFVCHAVILL